MAAQTAKATTGSSHLPSLGRRGGGWVAARIALMAAIVISAIVGFGWPASIGSYAYALGALLLAVGIGLVGAGGVGLGSALTPFPAPRIGGELQTTGVYKVIRHPTYGGGMLIALGWTIHLVRAAGECARSHGSKVEAGWNRTSMRRTPACLNGRAVTTPGWRSRT